LERKWEGEIFVGEAGKTSANPLQKKAGENTFLGKKGGLRKKQRKQNKGGGRGGGYINSSKKKRNSRK